MDWGYGLGRDLAHHMGGCDRRDFEVRRSLALLLGADLCPVVSGELPVVEPDEENATAESSTTDDAARAKEDAELSKQWEAVVHKCVKAMRESERKDWLREQREQERFERGSRLGEDTVWQDYSTVEYRE